MCLSYIIEMNPRCLLSTTYPKLWFFKCGINTLLYAFVLKKSTIKTVNHSLTFSTRRGCIITAVEFPTSPMHMKQRWKHPKINISLSEVTENNLGNITSISSVCCCGEYWRFFYLCSVFVSLSLLSSPVGNCGIFNIEHGEE